MKVTFYRLGERIIIETDNGALWWEAHAGLGALKRGKCFIRDEILFIGPGESEEPGFLKREFLDRLQEFPQWDRTKYCCSNYTIYQCASGRRLTGREIFEWAGNRSYPTRYRDFPQGPFGEERPSEEPDRATEVAYRLGQYEITKKMGGQVRWKTCSGYGALREGRCVIVGGILFMGSYETEERGNSKHTFLERLRQLPEWRNTGFYSPTCVIFDCRTGKNLVREEGGMLLSEARRTSTKGTFTPRPGGTASYPPSSEPWRTPLVDSSLSFLKRIAAKAGKGAERKLRGAGIKNKTWQKPEIIESHIKRWKASNPVCRIRRWVAYIGALILLIGSLLLMFFQGIWKNWEGHHKHRDHSSSHHRDH